MPAEGLEAVSADLCGRNGGPAAEWIAIGGGEVPHMANIELQVEKDAYPERWEVRFAPRRTACARN